jgi:hypothetical protein
MVRISYERYLLMNLLEKNENSVLKYYRRYDVEKFDEIIDKMKFTVNKKGVDKTPPLYDFQKKSHQ